MEKKDKFDYGIELSKEETERLFSEAVRMEKKKSRNNGKTTCEYDKERGRAYLLHPDGSREYYEEHDVKPIIKQIAKQSVNRASGQRAVGVLKEVPNRSSKRKPIPNSKRLANKIAARVVKRNG